MPATWHVCSQNWFCILCLRFILCLMIFHFARLTKTVRSRIFSMVVFIFLCWKGKMGIWLGKLAIFFHSLSACWWLTPSTDQSGGGDDFISFYFTFLFLCFEKYGKKSSVEKQIIMNEWREKSQFNFTLIARALIFALKLYLNVWQWRSKYHKLALNSMQFAMNS